MTHRGLTCLLIAVAIGALPPRAAVAEALTTERLLEIDAAASTRAQLAALLDRDDVRTELQRHGVSGDEAAARVAALSDAEVARIRGQLDRLAAGTGGGDVVLAALLIFLILIVLDLVGVTDVFPWVDPAN